MKLLPIIFTLLLLPVVAQAQQDDPAPITDGSIVVLPTAAQSCEMPVSTDPIAADADYDALVAAQKQVKVFQEEMVTYRACLDKYHGMEGLTQGNKQALAAAHNYTVDLEEQVAERFNVAVRAHKASKAKE